MVGIAWLLMMKAEPMHGVCLFCFINPFQFMLGEANKLENLNTYKMTDFTSKVETLNLILVSSIECGF